MFHQYDLLARNILINFMKQHKFIYKFILFFFLILGVNLRVNFFSWIIVVLRRGFMAEIAVN